MKTLLTLTSTATGVSEMKTFPRIAPAPAIL